MLYLAANLAKPLLVIYDLMNWKDYGIMEWYEKFFPSCHEDNKGENDDI